MPGLGQNDPGGHRIADVRPVNGQNVPAGHGMGTAMPDDGQIKPAGHERGKIDPTGHVVPAEHVALHGGLLAARYEPEPHDDTMGRGMTCFNTEVLCVATNMDLPERSKTNPVATAPIFAHR
jgi:hypothetical protein